MKRFIIISLILLTAASLLVLKWVGSREKAGEAAKPGKQAPAMVTGYVVKAQSLENKLKVTGTVTANQEVSIQSEIPGRVQKIFFREGNPVKKNELLLKITDDELTAQLARLELQKSLASATEQRLKDLRAFEGVSKQEYDVALNQLKVYEAEIALLNTTIRKTEIRAPFAGIIGLKAVSEGAYLTPSVVIAGLQEINPVKIDFSIPEKYLHLIKAGGTLNFTIQGLQETFTATIQAIEPRIDQATRTVLVRAVCPNPQAKIFPGAFADIELPLEVIPAALMVPTESVMPELKGQKLYVAKGGKAVSVVVETGLRNDSALQILNGISAGDTVITTGLMQLRPGATLKFLEVK